jgi:hypothetical protein
VTEDEEVRLKEARRPVCSFVVVCDCVEPFAISWTATGRRTDLDLDEEENSSINGDNEEEEEEDDSVRTNSSIPLELLSS